MKQCKNYEDALYCDCCMCDEKCEYRKEHGLEGIIVLILVAMISLFIYMII